MILTTGKFQNTAERVKQSMFAKIRPPGFNEFIRSGFERGVVIVEFQV